jgi:hypothetical protein
MNSFMKPLNTLIATALAMGAAHAAVIVSDNGLIAPTIGLNDTGYTGTTNQRFGWDNESFTQSFTAPTAGTIDSIYLGYNAFENGDTLTMTLSVNGSPVVTGLVLDGNNFSGVAGDNNAGPFYWMKFDLSAENVAVPAGSNNFTMTGTANTGNSWALAPRYALSPPDVYAGGSLTGLPSAGDLAFAVTVVPEPSVALLGGLGLFGLLRRRRA